MTKEELSWIEELDDAAIGHAIECLLHSDSADTSDLILAYDRSVIALKLSELLRPRIVTKEDFECCDEAGWIPVWTEDKLTGEVFCDCITIGALDNRWWYRYWTMRPSTDDIQKENEKENDTIDK